jgi:branched-chain amino acid transport system permease protein
MDYFLQQLVNGLSLGAIYALIAIGYTMVYGILGMINFAHGDIYMIGAFLSLIGFLLMAVLGISSVPLAIALVLILAIVFTALYGWTVERVAYRPLRGAPTLAPLISAIGVSIVLQNYVQLAQGARVKPMPPMVRGGFNWAIGDFHLSVSLLQILILVLTLALMAGFTYVIRYTPLGRAQRATEQDATMAALLGVNVDRTISATFVMGAALAGVAGLMVTLYYGVVDFYIGFIAGIKAFTAAVLGGIGSLPGAMLGGFLIGLIEAFWSGYFSIAYKDVVVFGVLVLVLTVRPTGLLGRPEVEKV